MLFISPKQMFSSRKRLQRAADVDRPQQAACLLLDDPMASEATVSTSFFIVMWARHASRALYKPAAGTRTGLISARLDQKKGENAVIAVQNIRN